MCKNTSVVHSEAFIFTTKGLRDVYMSSHCLCFTLDCLHFVCPSFHAVTSKLCNHTEREVCLIPKSENMEIKMFSVTPRTASNVCCESNTKHHNTV